MAALNKYRALTLQNGIEKQAQDADLLNIGAGIHFAGVTTSTRNAWTGVTEGDTFYNSTTQQIELYNGTSWIQIGSGPFQGRQGPGGMWNGDSTNPLTLWRYKFTPSEWSLTNKILYFRAVLSVDNVSYTCNLQVYNLTTNTAVAATNGLLTRSSLSPDLVTGTGITTAVTGFDPTTTSLLAFNLYINSTLASANAIAGSVEIAVF